MDYPDQEKVLAEPMAASMIETFRAIGYSLATAVADIIDNSISAGAKNIWIGRKWRGGDSTITIKDDGSGMSEDELVQAMRPGSRNPSESRDEKDLGRFGLGLKTAAFSQCKKLTLLSKKVNEPPVYWTWDIDYVVNANSWELVKWLPEEYAHELDDLKSGTIVIWSDLDRIVNKNISIDDVRAHEKFSRELNEVKEHLSMTFHRFLEEKAISIYWESNEIEPWNPFCPKEDKVQIFPDEILSGGVVAKGYVLPHQKNFSSDKEYQKAGGIKGWVAQEGFYVYRNKRLLLAGDWLGLFHKEEQYKLVRIKIDLPNSLDSEWQIDIKKSRAYPPAVCRDQLMTYAKHIRAMGLEVYKHRGKILKQRSGESFQPLWLEKKKDDTWSFVINRDNDIVKTVKSMAHENPDHAIDTLLKFIEESIPAPSIFVKEVTETEKPKEPFSDISESVIKEMISTIYKNKIADGFTPQQAKADLVRTEPFNNYEILINSL